MSEIILDISPNTHKNQIRYIKQMIDAIVEIDTKKHTVIFKHQLFMKSAINVVLDRVVFAKAHSYAESKGYKTTASVFDLPSLDYLMQFKVPFIKIACNKKYHWLFDEIPRKYRIYQSGNELLHYFHVPIEEGNWRYLYCVPEYPAPKEKYKELLDKDAYCNNISDHTVGLDLWHEYHPKIFEKHYVLHKNKPDNPDSGDFAVTPDELRSIL